MAPYYLLIVNVDRSLPDSEIIFDRKRDALAEFEWRKKTDRRAYSLDLFRIFKDRDEHVACWDR